MSVSILNVGHGDTRLTFDKDKPEERERAKRIVSDMLRLGYAILVKVGERKGKPHYRRAVGFDPELCEYLVRDVPEEAPAEAPRPRAKRRGRPPGRVSAVNRPAVSVGRSAGGMSAAADSIERENLRRFDSHADVREKIRAIADKAGEWAGVPMPLEDMDLVIEPGYKFAEVLGRRTSAPAVSDDLTDWKLRNEFYSTMRRCRISVVEKDGRVSWGFRPAVHSLDCQLRTAGASYAWGIEQEAAAMKLLATLLPHHLFKMYLMTGAFLETSERSGVMYMFRKLRPTLAIAQRDDRLRLIASLCMHPIAYYAGSWGGAMCPTDDVIAHLILMRGDEALYWRRCNQHQAWEPEAGI